MADKDLIRQYKDTIVELTKEKEENFKTIKFSLTTERIRDEESKIKRNIKAICY